MAVKPSKRKLSQKELHCRFVDDKYQEKQLVIAFVCVSPEGRSTFLTERLV